MSRLDEVPEPTETELWAIEAEADLLVAELALLEAEATLLARPSNAAVAAFLRVLLDVVDLHDFNDDRPSGTQLDPAPRRSSAVATAGAAS